MLTIWPMVCRSMNRDRGIWTPDFPLQPLRMFPQEQGIYMLIASHGFMYPLPSTEVPGLPMAAAIRQKLKCIMAAAPVKEQIQTITPARVTWCVKAFIQAAEAAIARGQEPL